MRKRITVQRHGQQWAWRFVTADGRTLASNSGLASVSNALAEIAELQHAAVLITSLPNLKTPTKKGEQ